MRPNTKPSLRLHVAAFVILFCVCIADPVHASNAEMTTNVVPKLNLIDFVARTLVQNDQALDIKDSLESARLNTSVEGHKFETQLVPLANIGAGTTAETMAMGLEARRNTEFGTEITVGVIGERIRSDSYVVENSHNTRAFIRVSQGLLRRWGDQYNRLGLTVAELELQKTDLVAHSAQQDLILSAVQTYYKVVLAKHLLRKTEQALTRRKEHLQAARSRQSVGLVSMADVYRAELALLDLETSLKNQQRAYSSSIEDMYEDLAMEKNGSLLLDEQITRITPTIMNDWEQQVLSYRPDWQAHVIDRQITNLSLKKAERDLLPDVSLELTLEQQGLGDTFEDSTHLDETNWSVRLQLYSTLERFQEKSAVKRERLRTNRLQREGRALKRRIQREASQAFEDLKAEERRHSVSRARLEQAEKGLELAKIRYNRGLSSNLEVLDSETAYTDAELDILRTLIDYNIAAVRLAHALGILDIEWIKGSLEPIEEDHAGEGSWMAPPNAIDTGGAFHAEMNPPAS